MGRKNKCLSMPSAMAYVGIITAFLMALMCLSGCKDEEINLDKAAPGYEANMPEYESSEGIKQAGASSSADTGYMYVYVCGAVNRPGVYELEEGSRIVDVIMLAGGMWEDAAPNYINQAAMLTDGEKIYIPTAKELEDRDSLSNQSAGTLPDEDKANASGLIDINLAGVTELMKIPGIGKQRAQSIVDYRNQNGAFETKEDVMKVSGIKAGTYEKMEPYIMVSNRF